MSFSLLRGRCVSAGLSVMLAAFWAVFPGSALFAADFTLARCYENGGELKFEYRLAAGAEAASVAVAQNGKALECRHIPFANNPLTPGAILVMVDTSSGSSRSPRDHTLAQNKVFIETLMAQAQPQDLIGVYSFANDLSEVAPLARPITDIHFRLLPLKANGLGTRIYRQGIRGVDLLAAVAAKRKTLVILSDGKDEDNGFTREDLAASALKNGVAICAMGCPESGTEVPALGNLEKLAAETHGLYAQAKIGESEPGERIRSDSAFARDVLALVNSGGEIAVPLPLLEGSGEVVFSVKTQRGETVAYHWNREAPQPEAAAVAAPAAPALQAPPQPAAQTAPVQPAATPLLQATPVPAPSAAVRIAPAAAANPSAKPAAPSLQKPIIQKDDRTARFISIGAIVLLAAAVVVLRYRSRPSRQSAPPAAPAFLVMQDAESKRIPVSSIATRIGRRPDNDIVFANTSVSGYHAEIHLQRDGTYLLTDLGSGNGLRVNNQSVSQAALADGDLVEMGEVRFRFHLAPGSEKQPPQSN